jgi:hypothetical protein
MKSVFLVRVENGQAQLPPMTAQGKEDCLTYDTGKGVMAGGFVMLSSLGLQAGQPKDWTNNTAIVLVHASDAVIANMKKAVGAPYLWLYDQVDPEATPTEVKPVEEPVKPGEVIVKGGGTTPTAVADAKPWLKTTAAASKLGTASKASWEALLDKETIANEGDLLTTACKFCGVTKETLKQGMIG